MSDFNLLPPRVAVVDLRTGLMSREWYLFFQQVFIRLGGNMGLGQDELLLGSSVGAAATAAIGEALGLALGDLGQAPALAPVPAHVLSYWPDYMPPVVVPALALDDLAPRQQTGSLGEQDANSVNITGGKMSGVAITTGSINNTPIGATTANTGRFTTLRSTSTTYLGSSVQIKGSSTLANAEAFIDCTDTTTTFYGSSSSGVSKTVNFSASGSASPTFSYDGSGATVSGTLTVATTFGCNSAAPQGSYPFNAAPTDLPTTIALLTQVRQALINNGIGS